MAYRKCSICRETKDEEEFRLSKKRRNGKIYTYRNSYCRECDRWYMRGYMRAYREKNGR